MGKSKKQPKPLTDLALSLLLDMEAAPQRVEYNTRVLGGMFRNEDVERLDAAYAELLDRRLVERAGAVISFFGAPKSLARITSAGLEFAELSRMEMARLRGKSA